MVCNEGYTRKKPVLSEEAKLAWTRCVNHLREVQKVVGPMIVEPAADKWFWEWYLNPTKCPDDTFIETWRESWHINLLKVASLISLSERFDRVITIQYMQLALAQLQDVETNLTMVTSRMGRSELTEPTMRVLTLIRLNGGFMLEKDLKLKTYKIFKDSTEQWKVIEWLKQTEQLKLVVKEAKTYLCVPESIQQQPRKTA